MNGQKQVLGLMYQMLLKNQVDNSHINIFNNLQKIFQIGTKTIIIST